MEKKSILWLGKDEWSIVLDELYLKDGLQLRRTCKKIFTIISLHIIWTRWKDLLYDPFTKWTLLSPSFKSKEEISYINDCIKRRIKLVEFEVNKIEPSKSLQEQDLGNVSKKVRTNPKWIGEHNGSYLQIEDDKVFCYTNLGERIQYSAFTLEQRFERFIYISKEICIYINNRYLCFAFPTSKTIHSCVRRLYRNKVKVVNINKKLYLIGFTSKHCLSMFNLVYSPFFAKYTLEILYSWHIQRGSFFIRYGVLVFVSDKNGITYVNLETRNSYELDQSDLEFFKYKYRKIWIENDQNSVIIKAKHRNGCDWYRTYPFQS